MEFFSSHFGLHLKSLHTSCQMCLVKRVKREKAVWCQFFFFFGIPEIQWVTGVQNQFRFLFDYYLLL